MGIEVICIFVYKQIFYGTITRKIYVYREKVTAFLYCITNYALEQFYNVYYVLYDPFGYVCSNASVIRISCGKILHSIGNQYKGVDLIMPEMNHGYMGFLEF